MENAGVWRGARAGVWASGVVERKDEFLAVRCEDGHDKETPNPGQPGNKPSEVIAGGGEDGVGGVAVDAFEEVAAQAVFASSRSRSPTDSLESPVRR